MYELGGEQKEISWPEVQSGYLAKYGVALVSEVSKSYKSGIGNRNAIQSVSKSLGAASFVQPRQSFQNIVDCMLNFEAN